ncbi:carbohydrate-binding module family 48 protein [[Candida] arabinofermentans NRRL YB-2248]|uniref:Carbohydrate-binding module family 48 protein n=1 Tax=[Candida] arabinofermentans NRRL YB-2248 TaxID=983967 RepID=A0A1E4ST25_9ASCO|nr:carbohydrate-binding module family 48 protein [[Candida] arabinofermentans NRRL YB-2248]
MTTFKYTFEWPSIDASEVYVTGTFDNWSKSCKLDKNESGFSKSIELPGEKILYKFVVDGVWCTSTNAKLELDSSGIENNVLNPSDYHLSGKNEHEEDGASEFTAISYPTSDHDNVMVNIEDTEDMASSTQVTLKDDQSVTNVSPGGGVLPVNSNGRSGNGIMSRLRSFFR